MQYDAWDYRLLSMADDDGMYQRETSSHVTYSWEQAADEATREERPCTYPLSLNKAPPKTPEWC